MEFYYNISKYNHKKGGQIIKIMEVAILASGRGSNFQSIIDASNRGELPNANVKLLIVNNKEAYAIERAKNNNIPYYIVESENKKRTDFDLEMLEILDENKIDIIVLAGFMRILSKLFVNKYNNKIINIHPSLLPLFPGAHAHRETIKAGVSESGCTVHFVDHGVDTGPIIMQKVVAINKNETEKTLAEKILPLEHQIFPIALNLLTSQKLRINEGKVTIETD
jgi:phosphoribosylglycinamide formyltransferase-1|tara:strand:+ start:1538 stop:2206 length:669 start_codon:yes stop_codon:yes gene_type:complete